MVRRTALRNIRCAHGAQCASFSGVTFLDGAGTNTSWQKSDSHGRRKDDPQDSLRGRMVLDCLLYSALGDCSICTLCIISPICLPLFLPAGLFIKHYSCLTPHTASYAAAFASGKNIIIAGRGRIISANAASVEQTSPSCNGACLARVNKNKKAVISNSVT